MNCRRKKLENKSNRGIIAIMGVILALMLISPITSISANAEISPIETAKSAKQTISYQMKRPIGKKQIALKFFIAMCGVATSSVVIFVLLSLYNKLLYGKGKEKEEQDNIEDNDFKTSTNLKDAINIFLKKTK